MAANIAHNDIVVSDAEMAAINIKRAEFHGEWNYTISPNAYPQTARLFPDKPLGSGALSFKRDGSVFINCSFDPKFRPAFDAIVFSTICCGFFPRCAIEA